MFGIIVTQEHFAYISWGLYGLVSLILLGLLFFDNREVRNRLQKTINEKQKPPVNPCIENLKRSNEKRAAEAIKRVTGHLEMFVKLHRRLPSFNELSIVAQCHSKTAKKVLEIYKRQNRIN